MAVMVRQAARSHAGDDNAVAVMFVDTNRSCSNSSGGGVDALQRMAKATTTTWARRTMQMTSRNLAAVCPSEAGVRAEFMIQSLCVTLLEKRLSTHLSVVALAVRTDRRGWA